MADLLFEAGLEEIPARMIAAAEAELTERVVELLRRERLLKEEHEIHSYSTPRRLAVQVNGVLARQPDARRETTGPAWSVAFKDGQPTAAAQAFARKAGVGVEALEKISTPKGEYVSANVPHRGREASEVLGDLLAAELAALYWPKTMYWRPLKPERFVRPVRWMVALLDHAILPVEFAGVRAANLTWGHRILHGDAPVTIDHPDDYLGLLEAAKVTADVKLRQHRIRKALDLETRSVPGGRWREDAALLETVTHLTEWPSVVLGNFDPEYLELPDEVLVTVMRDHQKYFAVENAAGKLEDVYKRQALELLRSSAAVASCGYVALAAHGTFPAEHLVVGCGRSSAGQCDCDRAGSVESGIFGAGGGGIREAEGAAAGTVAGDHRAAVHFAGDDGESRTALHDGDVSDGVSRGRVRAGRRTELNSFHAVHGD